MSRSENCSNIVSITITCDYFTCYDFFDQLFTAPADDMVIDRLVYFLIQHKYECATPSSQAWSGSRMAEKAALPELNTVPAGDNVRFAERPKLRLQNHSVVLSFANLQKRRFDTRVEFSVVEGKAARPRFYKAEA